MVRLVSVSINFLLAAFSVRAVVPTAGAADMFWSNNRGDRRGTFSTASHWSRGTASNPAPPDADDVAHFGMTTSSDAFPATSIVRVASSPTNRAIIVEDDFVTFGLNGRTDSTNGNADCQIGTVGGQSGALTMADGTWSSTGAFDQVFVGAVLVDATRRLRGKTLYF